MTPVPDHNGEAALLLAESTLHALIARGVLTVPDALDALDTAIEVQQALHDERADPALPPRTLRLTDMRDSLARDANGAATEL